MKYLGLLLFLVVFSSSGGENGVPDKPGAPDKSGSIVPAAPGEKALQSSSSGNGNNRNNGNNGDNNGNEERIPPPTGLSWTTKGVATGGTIAFAAVLATTPGADIVSLEAAHTIVFGGLVGGAIGHVADICGYYFRERQRRKRYPELFK